MNGKNQPFDLGEDYTILGELESKTKSRILKNATILFAEKGYADVSVKDIAARCELSPPSLYNHYESKEAIWEAVLKYIKGLYLLYFDRLDVARQKVTRFEDVLEAMFVELKQVVNIFTYYGFSLVQTEQFRSDLAGDIYLNTFLKYSIDYLAQWMDECVENGEARPFDTRTAATALMHTVLVGINVRVHEHQGKTPPSDVQEMFEGLQQFIYEMGKLPGS